MSAPLRQSCPLTPPGMLGSLPDLTTQHCPSPIRSVDTAFSPQPLKSLFRISSPPWPRGWGQLSCHGFLMSHEAVGCLAAGSLP